MHGGSLRVGWAAVGSQIAAVELDWSLEEWGPGWAALEKGREILSVRTVENSEYSWDKLNLGWSVPRIRVSRSQPIEDMRSHVRGDGRSAEKQARTRDAEWIATSECRVAGIGLLGEAPWCL